MTITEDLEPAVDRAPTEPRPTPRTGRRSVRLAVAAIAASLGVAALQLATDAPADEPSAVACTGADPSSGDACAGLWDRVRALDLPEDEWASAAEAMGLSARGAWISDDGLRWEHLDGHSYVVAAPGSSDDR